MRVGLFHFSHEFVCHGWDGPSSPIESTRQNDRGRTLGSAALVLTRSAIAMLLPYDFIPLKFRQEGEAVRGVFLQRVGDGLQTQIGELGNYGISNTGRYMRGDHGW